MIDFQTVLLIGIISSSFYLTYVGFQIYGLRFPNWDTYLLFYSFLLFNTLLLQKSEEQIYDE